MESRPLAEGDELGVVHAFARALQAAPTPAAILDSTVAHVERAAQRAVAIFLREEGDSLALAVSSAGFEPTQDVRIAAETAYRTGGGQTDAPFAVPLITPHGRLGALVLGEAMPARPQAPEPVRLLEVLAAQAALAIERSQLVHHARQVQLLQATEKLQGALLHSISHDLRTPLVTITVALSNLEAGDRLDEATRKALARTGRQEAERLNRLVGNLLDMTRIEAGALKVTEEACDVEDAIGAALDRLAPEQDEGLPDIVPVDERPVLVEVPAELAPVPMDLALMVQALANVLDNAVKYSPGGTEIVISAQQVEDRVEIRVADRGVGIRQEDVAHIFDKFYRVQQPEGVSGTGLGLAISKGIVEAHGGRIWAEKRPGGGTMVTIALPLRRPES